jgi:hypothetical protein
MIGSAFYRCSFAAKMAKSKRSGTDWPVANDGGQIDGFRMDGLRSPDNSEAQSTAEQLLPIQQNLLQ